MLIFEIEQKPQYKSTTVFGVEIPLYGELTVNEAIATEKAIVTDADQSILSNTEWARVQVSAWLIARLELVEKEIAEGKGDADVTAIAAKIKKQVDGQLNKSKALIDALWTVFYAEREGNTKAYELEEVSEGNENTERSVISMESGIGSISNSQLVDLRRNSLVILDEYESA